MPQLSPTSNSHFFSPSNSVTESAVCAPIAAAERSRRSQAQTSATTSVDKKSEVSLAAPNIAGAPVTLNGRDILSASVNGDRGFSGAGNSAQSNRLQGSVTVTVIQRLPNGNLVVQGQKNMRLNQGDELVQIQGIVRPADIGTDNTIASSKVADARIAFGGRGAIAQSNSMGWLGRFFNSPIFPN